MAECNRNFGEGGGSGGEIMRGSSIYRDFSV